MQLSHLPASGTFSLAIHGGAGPRPHPLSSDEEASYTAGLRRALEAGQAVLASDGTSVDAVCAAVTVLEDDENFNAGRGAALTSAGTIELDAALMDGTSGQAGAITGSTIARNPIKAARAVMERTRHVFLNSPEAALLAHWGVAIEDPSYFSTQRRREQLAGSGAPDASTPQFSSGPAASPGLAPRGEPDLGASALGHGTVGAVARDRAGNLAAATSTGGVTGQMVGRIGDSPLIGAGTYANADIAISCTGIGEYFVRAVLAHDVAARMAYGGFPMDKAVADAITEGLTERGGYGGLIGVDRAGGIVLAFNSRAMFRGYATDIVLRTEV